LDRIRGSHHVFKHPRRGVCGGVASEKGSRHRPGGGDPQAGSTVGGRLGEAIAGAEEAAAAWVDAALDAGMAIPPPSSLETVRRNSDYEGCIFGVVTLDPALFYDTVERVNITLPRRVLARLDALARAAGDARSGYVAQLTLAMPNRAT
jgi:hypothetical protein